MKPQLARLGICARAPTQSGAYSPAMFSSRVESGNSDRAAVRGVGRHGRTATRSPLTALGRQADALGLACGAGGIGHLGGPPAGRTGPDLRVLRMQQAETARRPPAAEVQYRSPAMPPPAPAGRSRSSPGRHPGSDGATGHRRRNAGIGTQTAPRLQDGQIETGPGMPLSSSRPIRSPLIDGGQMVDLREQFAIIQLAPNHPAARGTRKPVGLTADAVQQCFHGPMPLRRPAQTVG